METGHLPPEGGSDFPLFHGSTLQKNEMIQKNSTKKLKLFKMFVRKS